MFGLLVLPMIGLWLWFSYWLAGKATSKISTPAIGSESRQFNNTGRFLLHSVLTIFIILLPFIDQLIAYPKWQQLCDSTSDIHWAEGVDPNDYRGAELVVNLKKHKTTIFPMQKVRYNSKELENVTTGQLIAVMPHSSYTPPNPLFEFPSASGGAGSIFLGRCSMGTNSKRVVEFLERYDMKVIGYRRNQKVIKY